MQVNFFFRDNLFSHLIVVSRLWYWICFASRHVRQIKFVFASRRCNFFVSFSYFNFNECQQNDKTMRKSFRFFFYCAYFLIEEKIIFWFAWELNNFFFAKATWCVKNSLKVLQQIFVKEGHFFFTYLFFFSLHKTEMKKDFPSDDDENLRQRCSALVLLSKVFITSQLN